MKRHLWPAAALGIALMAGPAAAQFRGPSEASVTTVAQAADARHDTDVVLEGHIIAHQREKYYTFRDETGTMTVEIDRRDFRGQEVTPETRVRLYGEVDRSVRGRYIDVDRLELVN